MSKKIIGDFIDFEGILSKGSITKKTIKNHEFIDSYENDVNYVRGKNMLHVYNTHMIDFLTTQKLKSMSFDDEYFVGAAHQEKLGRGWNIVVDNPNTNSLPVGSLNIVDGGLEMSGGGGANLSVVSNKSYGRVVAKDDSAYIGTHYSDDGLMVINLVVYEDLENYNQKTPFFIGKYERQILVNGDSNVFDILSPVWNATLNGWDVSIKMDDVFKASYQPSTYVFRATFV